MSDSEFFREVEEEVRREKLNKLWDAYGTYVLGAAAAVVLGVAGFKGFEHWQTSRIESAGAKFISAETLATDGQSSDAQEAFERIVAEGPGGYPSLARLRLAAAYASDGKVDDAVAAYDRLTKDSSADKLLRGFAQVQAAILRLDNADFKEMNSRVGDLDDATGAWRHSARELLGLSAYKEKQFDQANTFFTKILGDQDSPQKIRQRAEMMLTLIAGETADKGSEDASTDEGAAAKDK